AYLDRINVGFAALQMNRQLHLSDAAYGFGAGLFFVGYFIFEIPSNLILQRVGARRWIARIMISWGAIAMSTVLVRGERGFYLLRFLLGVAEAGFFPGIILYLTYWFPAREQARAVAAFMTATALAGVIAGPLSGGLLTMHGVMGLAGWQWLFLLEGVPAVILGVAVALHLPDGPMQARWLSHAERLALTNRIAANDAPQARARMHNLAPALTDGRVWLLAALYFSIVIGLYGVSLWLPQIIKSFGSLSDLEVGFIAAVPFVVAAVAMVQVGKASDRAGERRWHLALSALVGAIGLAVSALAANPVLEMIAICVGAGGIWGTFGPFWSMPSAFLGGSAAAGGIALINSVGNLGGLAGPYAVGLIHQSGHGFGGGLMVMASALLVAAILALCVPRAAVAPPVELLQPQRQRG
ncbi:MAG: MFS transporter, partial [Candidatus Binataceae bacterium]